MPPADNPPPPALKPFVNHAVDLITHAVHLRHIDKTRPFLIAIDGGSGAGKSTIASALAEKLSAALLPGDDFLAADIPAKAWAQRDPKTRAADCIDWQRLRREALEPLLAGKNARWHAFDFESGPRPDGTYAMLPDFIELASAIVILLDGVYSTRPELSDLIDLSVCIDVPVALRHQRLVTREDSAFLTSWHSTWDATEDFYFTHVRPASSFDLVIPNP